MNTDALASTLLRTTTASADDRSKEEQMADDPIAPRRPRSLNGAQEAVESIAQAERMGLIPVAGEPELDNLTGDNRRDPDVRARPATQKERSYQPFKVAP